MTSGRFFHLQEFCWSFAVDYLRAGTPYSAAGRAAAASAIAEQGVFMNPKLEVLEVPISGHAQHIVLRHYRPTFEKDLLPIVLYFHGGGFIGGSLDEAETQAAHLAESIPAWVISVGYSLAPKYPFPAAPEDAFLALRWAIDNARTFRADARRIALAGHDAGGNIANGLAAMTRDRGGIRVAAQALIGPLLDPSMTRIACDASRDAERDALECARQYRAWLPSMALQVHPYAAPIESRRLGGMPPTLVISAEKDPMRAEAELYAGCLIQAGVPTEAMRRRDLCHRDLVCDRAVLDDAATFLRRRLAIP